MKQMIGKIMGNYGLELKLETEGVVAVCHGFFQPAHENSLQRLELSVEELGRNPSGKYEIMVPPEMDMDVGIRVYAQGWWYVVRGTEIIYGGNVPLYRWGLLVREGLEDGDIS